LILQYKLTSAGGLDNIARPVGIEYGPVLVIEGKLAVVSFQEPVDSHVENVHLILQALVVGIMSETYGINCPLFEPSKSLGNRYPS
jgi:hypothetical protein